MKRTSQSEFELLGAVESGSFKDAEALSKQIADWTKDQLYTELDCGLSTLESSWVAAGSSVQELSEKVKDDIEDLDSDVELVKISVKIELEIVRNGG